MTFQRTVALAVAAWLVVVIAGATLVWAVISQAGQGVVDDDPDAAPAADGTNGASPSPGDTFSSSPSPSRSPTRSPSGSPSGPSSGQSSGGAPVTGTPVTRAWQGPAGYVAAECTGSVIRGAGSHPNPGWTIELDDNGPDRVRVEFESSDGDQDVRVEAFCVDGVPTFQVDDD